MVTHWQRPRTATLVWLFMTGLLLIYWLVLADSVERRILFHTLALGLSTAVGAVLLGGIWAVAIWGDHSGARLLRAIALAVALMPPFLHLSVWDAAIGKLGWMTAGSERVFQPLVPTWLAAWWVHTTAVAPFVGLLIFSYLASSGRQIEEQLRLEASGAEIFWRVTLWRLRPVLWVGALWGLISACREIAVTDLYQIGTLAEQIYLGFSLAQPDRGFSVGRVEFWQAPWWLQLLTITWVGTAAASMLTRQIIPPQSANQGIPATAAKKFDRWQWLAVGVVLILFVLVPIFNLVTRASMEVVKIDSTFVRQYTWSAFARSMSRVFTQYSDSLVWSFWIGLTGAVVGMSVGLVWAWFARRRVGVRLLYWFSIVALLAIPGPVIGLLFFQVIDSDWGTLVNRIIDRTILLPVLAAVCFCWPLIGIACWFTVREVPEEWTIHADLDGVPQWRQISVFVLRGKWKLVLGLFLLVATIMFGELSASQMVLPPGMDTLPRLMLGLLHAGVDEMTAALSLVLVGIVVLTAFAAQFFARLNYSDLGR